MGDVVKFPTAKQIKQNKLPILYTDKATIKAFEEHTITADMALAFKDIEEVFNEIKLLTQIIQDLEFKIKQLEKEKE